jgi:hypothetical protein
VNNNNNNNNDSPSAPMLTPRPKHGRCVMKFRPFVFVDSLGSDAKESVEQQEKEKKMAIDESKHTGRRRKRDTNQLQLQKRYLF